MPTTSVGFDDGGGLLGRDALVRYGPTIYVQIGFDAEYQSGGGEGPSLPNQKLAALVDTGALES